MTSVAQAAPGATADFSASFEDAEQAKPSSNTVELGADGTAIQQGVSGGGSTEVQLKDSVLGEVTAVQASAENTAGGELAQNLKDGASSTKWLAFSSTGWAQYQLNAAKTVLSYSLTSADDAPPRDPAAWQLQGSANGSDWTTVDSRTAQSFAQRGLKQAYEVRAPGSYSYYRLNITKTGDVGIVQLADWDIATGGIVKPGPGAAKPMDTAVGNGPSAGFNIKANAGFTGVRALKYGGTKTAAGQAFATNKLFDVNIPVGPQSRLSYKIIPTEDYVNYLSSYVAVDLHFTDGSYLSQLSATDQNGIALTAQGQGDGKILYVGQWNFVQSDIGSVARGKTIDRILFSFSNATAPASSVFSGWLDDLKIEGAAQPIDPSSRTHYVDTRRGSNASGSFSRGNNLPLTAVPNGFNFLTPVTNASSSNWEYSYQSSNNASNKPTLQGLAVSHIPSPWMGDRNQFSVMPTTDSGVPSSSKQSRALPFSHDNETAQPDYYSVKLDGPNPGEALQAEMTASDHGAIMRFSYPGDRGNLVFDTPGSGGNFTLQGNEISGTVPAGGGSGQGQMYVYGSFSRSPLNVSSSGTRYAAFDTSTDKSVELSFATSFISADQAKKNFGLEISGQSFEQVRGAAQQLWNDRLAVIDVEGANDSQLTTMYSNLYRLNLYPNSGFENTGTAATPKFQYRSPVNAGKIVDGKIYVNNGFWDTYRTAWPAYSLLYPQKAAELVDGFVQQYRDGGWIARWSSPGYADLMTGTSSDVAFADAYLKGVPLPDPLSAYDAAVRNASVPSTNDSAVGRKGLTNSIFQGFTSTKTGESVSWGLEGFINDFGLGNMAAKLAVDPATPESRRVSLKEESAYYLNRAQYYVNMFDTKQDFFNGLSASGEFNAGLDPESWGGLFTETDGWNFAFHAPQDGQGLASLYGGPQGLQNKLDAFFATSEDADKPGGYGSVIHEMLEARAVRMGQLGMSNQVSHHIPYIYNYTTAPYKTQSTVREILQRLYVGSEIGQGYSGDEDNGEMSAWAIFSSLGFYPLQVGSPQFSIGSPQFTKATVHWGNGKDLVINAPNNSVKNVYVQSLRINGKDHPSSTLEQSEIANGGTLDFVMGPQPSDWGKLPATATKVPEPLMDTTVQADLSSSSGENLKNLTDDNSVSQVAFSVAKPVITLNYPAAAQKASFYTLTSSSAAAGSDPSAWTLEGSKDGKTWTELDSRKDQSFSWRLQTRPFQITAPTAFTHYRLTITATRDGSSLPVLSELEILAKASDSVAGDLVVSAAEPLKGTVGKVLQATLGSVGGGSPSNGYTATVDWGDSSAPTSATVAGNGVVRAISGSHSYTKPGVYAVTITATDGKAKQSASLPVSISVPAIGTLEAGFDKVCLGDDSTVPNGYPGANCDSVGYSYSRQALAAAGITQGTANTVTLGAKTFNFTLPKVAPGQPDNAMGNGQVIKLPLSPESTAISFIGTGTQGDQNTQAKVTFTDGSTASLPLQFSDWTLGGNSNGSPLYGNTVVAKSAYRLAGSAKDGAVPFLFATAPFTIPAGKTIDTVTLPQQSGEERSGRIHVFAIATDGKILPLPELKLSAGPALSASTEGPVQAALGTVSGGSPGLQPGESIPAQYSARVNWGDGTPTEDAVLGVPDAKGVAGISAQHHYANAGSYTVNVTASDALGSRTVQLPVTVSVPAKPNPELTIAAPAQVVPGSMITVNGRKFDAAEKVSLLLSTDPELRLSAAANAQGVVSFQFAVPQGTKPGPYAITLIGDSSKVPVAGTIMVSQATPPIVYRPNAQLGQNAAARGERVQLTGDSFAPNELVSVTLHSDPLLLVTARADAHGILSTSFVVPQKAILGQHQVVIAGVLSKAPISVDFTVQQQPVGQQPGNPGTGTGQPGSGPGGAVVDGSGAMPGTGFDTAPLAVVALGALLAGGLLLLSGRRRRRS
ncbi:GH92 family glycosyl hydrolase [Psychromicrobium sp. YIM B11713]|uniref:GH92 family glycosyl hydrolase n=1 Tax=Psychromicrobium sp. YIM B11713 TaxID=3145233 RepID=UPI00374FB794